MFVGKTKTQKVSQPKSLLPFPLLTEPPRDPSYPHLSHKTIIIITIGIIVIVFVVAVFTYLLFRRSRKSPPLWHIPVCLL